MRIRAIIIKELRLLLRDPAGLIMLFVLPALFITTLSVALQGVFAPARQEDRLALLVVNNDSGPWGDRIVERLDSQGIFSIRREDGGGDQPQAALRSGRYRVVVVIPEGASDAVRLEARADVQILLDPVVSLEVAHAVEAVVRSISCASTIEELLSQAGLELSDLEDDERDRGLGAVRTYHGRAGQVAQPNVVQQNVPGWTIFALFWMAQVLALSLLQDRTGGLEMRLAAAPISPVVYLAGKLVPFLGINLLQALAMFGVGVYVVPLLGCPQLEIVGAPALALLTVSLSLVALSFGLLLATLSRSTVFIATTSAVVLIVMAVLGGVMVPKFVMPEMMQRLSLLTPHGWALDGYLAVLVQGAGLADILPNAGALLAFALPSFAVAAWRLRR